MAADGRPGQRQEDVFGAAPSRAFPLKNCFPSDNGSHAADVPGSDVLEPSLQALELVVLFYDLASQTPCGRTFQKNSPKRSMRVIMDIMSANGCDSPLDTLKQSVKTTLGAVRVAVSSGLMAGANMVLETAEQGNTTAKRQSLSVASRESRRQAAHKMAREAPGDMLQPTSLVPEAWLSLRPEPASRFENRAHFFDAATEARRRTFGCPRLGNLTLHE
jgi:hypothetical protein